MQYGYTEMLISLIVVFRKAELLAELHYSCLFVVLICCTLQDSGFTTVCSVM